MNTLPPPEKLQKHTITEYDSEIFSTFSEFSHVVSYYHTEADGYPINMHQHSFYEINIVTKSAGYHYIENQRLPASSGNVFVIPPNITHGYYTDDTRNFTILHILLSPRFIKRYKNELKDVAGYSSLFEIEPLIRSKSSELLFLRLNEEMLNGFRKDFDEIVFLTANSNPANNIKLTAKTLYLIATFSELLQKSHIKTFKEGSSGGVAADSISIIQTMNYIINHFCDKITLEDLAKFSNMSRSSFAKNFKDITNYTPMEYLNKIRVDKGAEMLTSTNYSIAKIAQECGFFDSSHFSKNFYLLKKQTPSEYKKTERKHKSGDFTI